MDLTQRKLNKAEWESIEIPISQPELSVLNIITSGYNNIYIKSNNSNSLFTFLKIEYTKMMEDYLYNKFFSKYINIFITKYNAEYLSIDINSNIKIKKADEIRITQNDNLSINHVYEMVLISQIETLFKNRKTLKWIFSYFTIYKLIQNNIKNLNRHIIDIVQKIIKQFEPDINLSYIIEHAVEFIENNKFLLEHNDMMLYEHQKEIFTIVKEPNSKLILYIAPTGTGKTLTPIGLSENNRIIFVCAARHVGLALAKSAISANKKIAFAFGCSSAEDVKLHYFSAKEYTVNKRTGGIKKVDNSIGDKVEIMICDIKSYLPAMYYMLAFNEKENIITYWDEPTITLDYGSHAFHEIIKRNWGENIIPNMVLSSATLPKIHELSETIGDFKEKFPGAIIYNIVSNDCRKTIPIINKDGYVAMPHYMSETYDEIKEIVTHFENNLTLLRYLDLAETTKFITFVETTTYIRSNFKIARNFGSIDDINLKNIKTHYLNVLKNLMAGTWGAVFNWSKVTREIRLIAPIEKIKKIQSIGPGIQPNGNGSKDGTPLVKMYSEQILPQKTGGNCAIYITTKDAHTLTDGPTIFLAEDVEKVAKFYIQQSKIPARMTADIIDKIYYNNTLNDNIGIIEKTLEDMQEAKNNEDPKLKLIEPPNKSAELAFKLETLKSMIKLVSLPDLFIPNKVAHIKKWSEDYTFDTKNAFASDIDESIVTAIMMLTNIEDSWKILLLLGIGVFTSHENIAYTEIMKKLADQQKLYLIIASSDYIYGTNYQFCHGYLSKNMNLTQEKIIQFMGRIGRGNIQQTYSIRFRDDEVITKIFTHEKNKPEIINMNLLFNSKNVTWDGSTYIY